MDELNSIVTDYRCFPLRLSPDGNSVTFVEADRDAHRAVTFLDDELLRRSSGQHQLPLQKVALLAAELPASDCHFIFHSAFCCSTLLARSFDMPGKSMALKEPKVLTDLVAAAFASGQTSAVRGQLEPVLSLLARPFGEGEKTIVKPSNAANPLIEQILDLRPTTKALFLSSPLPDYLRSLVKKGLWGRIWARKALSTLNRFPQLQLGYSEAERWEHSDLQVAALVWLDHRAQFTKILSLLPPQRAVSMDSSVLLDDPARALGAVSSFFGIGLSADEVEAVERGPVFATHSKHQNEEFDVERRRDEHAAVTGVLAEEIAMVTEWADSVADYSGVPKHLPQPLLR